MADHEAYGEKINNYNNIMWSKGRMIGDIRCKSASGGKMGFPSLFTRGESIAGNRIGSTHWSQAIVSVTLSKEILEKGAP